MFGKMKPMRPQEEIVFWVVYCPNGSPPKIHKTLACAKAEAERLAQIHQNVFFVLKTVGFAEPDPPKPPPVQWTEIIS